MALMGKGTAAIQNGVDNRRDFTVGNVSGRTIATYEPDDKCQLPTQWRDSLRAGLADGRAYVIYSYKTPIAWFTLNGGWTIPDVRYSKITSNHQNVVRVATTHRGFYADAHDRELSMRRAGAAPIRLPVNMAETTPDQPTIPTPQRMVESIDRLLDEVASQGWTNPYTNADSPAHKLAS